MSASESVTETVWIDPDDAPELDDEWFKRASVYHGDVLISRGRRPEDDTDPAALLPLDADVAEALRTGGPAWTLRANAVLRAWIAR